MKSSNHFPNLKQGCIAMLTALLFASCATTAPMAPSGETAQDNGTSMTQSLFSDKNATISEENIQKILDGNYHLPQKLRVALVKLESQQRQRHFYWSDEQYLKSQQAYLDLFTQQFKNSGRVTNVSVIPDLLISGNPTFTSIREAAVRTQADVVVVYSISSDIYSRYRLFSKTDIKAFATTQLIILDVRTGLIPFSTIVTKDFQSQKQKEELSDYEAGSRTKNEAVLLTIGEIGHKIASFLETK